MRVYPVAASFAVNNGTEVKNVCEVWCVSTDTKPTTGLANGSIAVEIDTGKVFFFNEADSSWVEQFSFQG